MRNIKKKYILQSLAVASVLITLLVSMNGCEKKPATTESSSTAETTTETTTAATTTETTTAATTTETTVPEETTEETTEAVCEHILSNWIVETTSNCTKEGSRYKECTLCKEIVETEAIPKTSHTASNWIVDVKATCTEEGAQHQECTQCAEKIASIVVAKTDHKPYAIKGQGYTVGYMCSACHDTLQKQYEIPAEGTVLYTYQVKDNTCVITGVENWSGSELILPATIDGKTVTGIGKNAFTGNKSIKTVYIPKTITELGDKVFSGCSAITTIVYEGTTTEWNTAVTKGNLWNQNTGSYKIYCTNNNLAK